MDLCAISAMGRMIKIGLRLKGILVGRLLGSLGRWDLAVDAKAIRPLSTAL